MGDLLALYPNHVVWIDVAAFEAAATAARRSGNVERYHLAISSYPGDLLPEDRYEDWAAERRQTLRALWLTLLRELAALYGEQGAWGEAIVVLQQITSAEPADEPAHVSLMRMYASAGQRLQALRQYQHLRDRLQEELDVEPDLESTRLYESILAGRVPAIMPSAESRAVNAGDTPDRRATTRVQLPVELTSFVGRRQEINDVADLLRHARLITLIGPGGSGKTRLAVAVASEIASECAGGVWFVDLAPLADPALVVTAVAAAVGAGEDAGRSQIAAIAGRLHERPSLILLDNCEHLIEACAVLADALMRDAPLLRIMATTRETLRVGGEVIYPVPPLRLDLPRASTGDEDAITDPRHVEAVQLFVERARLADPRFAVTDASVRSILELCRRLDGMPLAIELAAARARALPIEELIVRLDDALGLLGGGARTIPTRQQSLRGAIDCSIVATSPARSRSTPER